MSKRLQSKGAKCGGATVNASQNPWSGLCIAWHPVVEQMLVLATPRPTIPQSVVSNRPSTRAPLARSLPQFMPGKTTN